MPFWHFSLSYVMKAQEQEKLAMKEMKHSTRTSVSDGIVEQVVDLISRDVLKPGDRLPSERELCKRLGVGRSSLREALRSLASHGDYRRAGWRWHLCF